MPPRAPSCCCSRRPSLCPCLTHDGIKVWDTLAIGEYLNELKPEAGVLPKDRAARAHCRAVSGEMHSGFSNLRSALPMNLRAHYPGFKVWAGVQADIDRVIAIWRECLAKYGGPFLFGETPTMADAMYAPVATRFLTYDIKLDSDCAAYCAAIMALPAMQEWIEDAKSRARGSRRARRGVLSGALSTRAAALSWPPCARRSVRRAQLSARRAARPAFLLPRP